MDLDFFNKIKLELEEDIELHELNLKEKSLSLPSIRHKWVTRLMEQKIELSKLNHLRREAIETLMQKIKDQEPITLSDVALKKSAEKHEVVIKIDKQISYCEILIEYLEKEEVNIRSIGYDIKNLLEIMKLEVT